MYPRVLPCLLAATAAVALVVTSSRTAHAEPTSWLAVGGGVSVQHNGVAKLNDAAGAFTASIGVGTSADHAVVVGGIFRTVTHWNLGTDLGLGARFASRGFCRGDFGVAVDLGVVGRFWEQGHYGEYPLQAVVTVGLPWGFQAGVGAQAFNLSGSPQAAGGFVVLELDLLRLTVMRQGSSTSGWKNVAPAGGVTKTPSTAPGLD